jgi:hypothetical protein
MSFPMSVAATEAFEHLVQKYQDLLFSLVLMMVRQLELAQKKSRRTLSFEPTHTSIATTKPARSIRGWRPSQCGWRRTGCDVTDGRCASKARRSKLQRSQQRRQLR